MLEGHGDDIYKYNHDIIANFSSNIYGHIDLSDLQAYLAKQLNSIRNYPEPESYTLEGKIAEKYGIGVPNVCVTSGATEAIYLIATAFRDSNSHILQPTFQEYADACLIHGHQIKSIYQLPLPGSSLRLPEDAQMCWICNPNNPTGLVIDKSYLADFIRANDRICFVIDQSYENFTLKSYFSPEEAISFPNLLQLHSLTKQYGVPGLRIGYIVGEESLLKRIRSYCMPWSVNTLANKAGLFLLEHGVKGMPDLPDLLIETNRLREKLKRLNFLEVWDTDTHMLLVQSKLGRASALKKYLLDNYGILIRDASNFQGLNEYFFRISTQRSDENDKLISALECWAQE